MTAPQDAVQEIWADDVLERQVEADYLTEYLTKRYDARKKEPGFVLALDSDWGYGKTFMLERWRSDLQSQRHPVVLFDAWNNDFTPEPLIAFISEMDAVLEPFFKHIPAAKTAYAAAKRSIKKVLKPAGKAVLFSIIKQIFGMSQKNVMDAISEVMGDASDGGGKEKRIDLGDIKESLNKAVDTALTEHQNTKSAINSFKEKLGLLIDTLEREQAISLPMFIFVDELDRCRPDYSIELLEGIKHLFGVRGIYFVVATNINELSHSIRAVYGEGFNGERYLKRFFDMEYTLPEPSNLNFAKELFIRIGDVPEKMITGLNQEYAGQEAIILPIIFSKYCDFFERGLRDQLQIMRIVENGFMSLRGTEIHIHFLIFLATLYQRSPSNFQKVKLLKTISSTDDFGGTMASRLQGNFSVINRDADPHRMNRNLVMRDVNVVDIIVCYLQAIRDKLQLSREDINSTSFPKNLMLPLQSEINLRRGGVEDLSVEKYFHIVERAGNFVNRSSTR